MSQGQSVQGSRTQRIRCCLICGSSQTVKSHLLPRALVLDMRAGAKHVVAGSRHRDGVLFEQNGEWDDTILCKAHEDQIGRGDDYAVRFIRSWRASVQPAPEGKAFILPNPHPDLLMHFVYATIWRVVVSRAGERNGVTLGPYGPIVRESLLGGDGYLLQTFVSTAEHSVSPDGPTNFAIYPYPTRFGRLRSWRFAINSLTFDVLTDKRRLPAEYAPYLANGNDQLIATRSPPIDLRTLPPLQPLLQRMKLKPGRRPGLP